jgi:purine-nucleoside phosphorylase|tara:strand:- start:10851 stop:11675 length:825 start_codon:yes stop_codon:yes gene_type:complete
MTEIKIKQVNENKIVEFLNKEFSFSAEIGIVLGSGLGTFTDMLEQKEELSYNNISGYPQSMVQGHAGKFVMGKLNGIPVLAASGRFHYYEGYDIKTITLPIRIFNGMGINSLLITNAAGSARHEFEPGDLMLITGYLDCTFRNGIEPPQVLKGGKFCSIELYDSALTAGDELDVSIHNGVYAWTLGPAYETPAEIEMIRGLGGDAVGMSTLPEVIAATELGMKVLGISCLTNYAAGITNKPLTHDEVIDTSSAVAKEFNELLKSIVLTSKGSGN